jgi:hypothetical protein
MTCGQQALRPLGAEMDRGGGRRVRFISCRSGGSSKTHETPKPCWKKCDNQVSVPCLVDWTLPTTKSARITHRFVCFWGGSDVTDVTKHCFKRSVLLASKCNVVPKATCMPGMVLAIIGAKPLGPWSCPICGAPYGTTAVLCTPIGCTAPCCGKPRIEEEGISDII